MPFQRRGIHDTRQVLWILGDQCLSDIHADVPDQIFGLCAERATPRLEDVAGKFHLQRARAQHVPEQPRFPAPDDPARGRNHAHRGRSDSSVQSSVPSARSDV